MKSLAADPGRDPDFRVADEAGREINGIIENVYAIVYFVDHAVKEIKVLDLRFADVW